MRMALLMELMLLEVFVKRNLPVGDQSLLAMAVTRFRETDSPNHLPL